MNKISNEIIKELYPKRDSEAKKYDHGSVLIIGGSKIYSGTPALSGLAGLRAGADIVQIAAPRRAADLVAGFSPDLITHPLKGDNLKPKHLSKLLEITKSMESASRGNFAVVIGGGVGRREETKKLIRQYVKEVEVPVVIDADGIYAFESDGAEFLKENCLFTPHLYEYFILTNEKIDQFSIEDSLEKVKRQAATMGINLLLKGPTDIISDGQEVFVNEMAVPELTAGGCGDSLAGIAGALASRTKDLLRAGMGAVYINTKAGKLAADEKGESLIAEDLIEKIPEALK